MLHARSYCRSAAALAVRALVAGVCGLVLTTSAAASTIDLSLNVFYNDPQNAASGGTWAVVAKSQPGSDFGISALSLRLLNINPTVQFHAPRGTVNGSQNAGFSIQTNVNDSPGRNITIGQAPLSSPAGPDQSLFYGVGTLTNGSPNYPGKPAAHNAIGPSYASLANLQNVPWAPVPPGDVFGNTAWDRAVRFVSGTFAAGVTPAFNTVELTSGQVFTSLPPSSSGIGASAPADITTIVRTNLSTPSTLPDYNGNGVVDAADYVLWRKLDINGAAGYDNWKAAFGNTSGPAAGSSHAVVPEPASAALAALVALAALAWNGRRRS